MASAIGRSNEAPSFRRSAGARFTVIRSAGKGKPALRIAVRTRSRLSRTAESGSPTVVNAGRPGVTSTSTRTRAASTPTRAADRTRASTSGLFDRPAARVNVAGWIRLTGGPGAGPPALARTVRRRGLDAHGRGTVVERSGVVEGVCGL